MTVAERALKRIREEMTERHLSQRDLADQLQCSQSRVAKILGLGVKLRVDDLSALAQAVRLPLLETIRDRGLEFYAEMTPSELRIIERVRQRPELLPAILTILDAQSEKRSPVSRSKNRIGRPRDTLRKNRPL